MRKAQTRILAGVAVAALAAAGVATVIRYRQGHRLQPDDTAHLDELEARLDELDGPQPTAPPTRFARTVEDLGRNRGISVARLRQWIAGLKHGTLTSDQAILAESDFDTLEHEAGRHGT